MDAVYSHKINGGPLSENALWVTRYDLNKKLAIFGLQIIANRSGPGALWRLEKLG